MLPRHARCVLSLVFAATDTSLLLSSYLSRIGRIENPPCSACGHSFQDTSHLILHCPATGSAPLTLWRLSVSLRPLVQALGNCPASGAPWPSAMPPSLERGRVTNNNNNNSFTLCSTSQKNFFGLILGLLSNLWTTKTQRCTVLCGKLRQNSIIFFYRKP